MNKAKFSRIKIWGILFLLPLILAACTNITEGEVDDSTLEILSSILFFPEDLDDGWYVDTYVQFNQTTDFDPNTPSVKATGAFIQAEPGSPKSGKYHSSPPSLYQAGQSLFEYTNEIEAKAAGENIRQILTVDQFGIKSFDIIYASQLEIIDAGCRLAQGPDIGTYDLCFFTIQHGRYISRASMTVDGKLITMDDWEDFINAIQVKLIEQVTKENES